MLCMDYTSLKYRFIIIIIIIFSEPTDTMPILRSRHPVRRHATKPPFSGPIFFRKNSNFINICMGVLQRVILQSPRLDNDDECLGLEFRCPRDSLI